jgi:hypothetical protein
LRGGERKDIPLCHYRKTPGDTFARLFISYEDDDGISFDPDERNIMSIGLYSEGAPTLLYLKFERGPDGLVKVSEVHGSK